MQVYSGFHFRSALKQTTEHKAENQKQHNGRVTIAPDQRPRKRLALEKTDQASLNKRTCIAESNRTRKLTFSEDTKKHDGKFSDSRLQRMTELGLNNIQHFGLNRACENRLAKYSDPRELLLLCLFAQEKKADTELIDRIKTKLATTLCSDLLMDALPPWEIGPPCSYHRVVRLYQNLACHESKTLEQHTLDEADAECLNALRGAIFERVVKGALTTATKLPEHQHCTVSKVIELYTAYRDEGCKNDTGIFSTELPSVNAMLGELVMMIPKDLLVSQYLTDLRGKYKYLGWDPTLDT